MTTPQKLSVIALFFWAVWADATPKLEWTLNDPAEQVTKYRIWEQIGTNWVLLAEVPGTTNSWTITNAPGPHTFALSAANMWGETPRTTNDVRTPGMSSTPVGFKLTITIP